MTPLKTDKFYIHGEWVSPVHQHFLPVINPATEEPIGEIAMGNSEDVDNAVAAAQKAFETFSQTTKKERLALLLKIREVYERRYNDMSELICAELGAPIDLCNEAQTAVGILHLDATIAALELMDFESTNHVGDTLCREPIGVCGLITPWNWPINQIALKVFPALAAGCTMVLKPSEVTPLNALLMAEILDEAGTPPGVFNLINGDGVTVGSALSKHPDIAMMSFTGSTRAGVSVSQDAASTVKRVTLELGGKSPNIILPDADLKTSIQQNMEHCFSNSGQSCNAPTRMLISEAQYQEAIDIIKELSNQYLVNLPTLPGEHIGPVVSETQFNRVQELIKKGLDEGASLLMGGPGKPEEFEKGYFIKPTVFAQVSNQMAIAQEEIFGPVLVVIPYKDENEAIQIANDTPYGLAAYVQSSDLDYAHEVARKLRAGMVRINGTDINEGSPFGGYKLSGNGREGGVYGIEDFSEMKVISKPGVF